MHQIVSRLIICLVLANCIGLMSAQTPVGLIKMPYRGARNVAELSDVPDYLEKGGLVKRLEAAGAHIDNLQTVTLSAEEQRQYGEWNRLGLANGRLAQMVAANQRKGLLNVGLLANCSSLMGMLAGLQNSGEGGVRRSVGLVFIDAHGDFNTPETTLSGMLGGMPVAISAGLCLRNLRLKSGLDPALPRDSIVLGCVRDTDPLEEKLIQENGIARLSVEDIRRRSPRINEVMEKLSRENELIYIHIDMDVLDPKEVSGHPLTVPNGPTSRELAAAIQDMFLYPKTVAIGVASTPSGDNDPGELSREAAFRLILGAIAGVQAR